MSLILCTASQCCNNFKQKWNVSWIQFDKLIPKFYKHVTCICNGAKRKLNVLVHIAMIMSGKARTKKVFEEAQFYNCSFPQEEWTANWSDSRKSLIQVISPHSKVTWEKKIFLNPSRAYWKFGIEILQIPS